MSSFLDFIYEDVEAKKTLFSTMPTKTKKNQKEFNQKIDSISKTYEAYEASVKKYIEVKSKSFTVKCEEKNIEELTNKVNNLEHVKFVLNPTNTYVEKMGFDNLLYEISNYYEFNFNSLNDIINKFLDKFDTAGIKLGSSDFQYTYYVHEYMSSFLDARNNEGNDYDKVSEIFEKIYWANPDIIGHIELNFRKLIRKNVKKFDHYITKLKKDVMSEHKVSNYEDCLAKLKDAYVELNKVKDEDICDIINLSKEGTIDMNNYFAESKNRTSAYTELTIDSLNFEDEEVMNDFYDNLKKLKANLKEFDNYTKFLPLVDDFKNEYQSEIPNDDKDSSVSNMSKHLKELESQIDKKEDKLEKLNKKIFNGKLGMRESKDVHALNRLKIDSVKQAKVLYDLYKELDQESFKYKVLTVLNSSLTISEVLHLYYSFDYYKKVAIKKVFEVASYDEIIEKSREFDLFAMDPTNIIIKGIAIFEENNIARIIMNKHRLNNINLTEDALMSGDLTLLFDKIELLLRVNKIEKSETTVEKIWFMVEVDKIKKLEEVKEEETPE